jgi:hypothetical protein
MTDRCSCRWFIGKGLSCRLRKWINVYLGGDPKSLRPNAPMSIAHLQPICLELIHERTRASAGMENHAGIRQSEGKHSYRIDPAAKR